MSLILDVAIGITFLYLVLALLVTTLQELIAAALGLRAKNLYDAIAGMLLPSREGAPPQALPAPDSVGTLLAEVYDHPLVKNLRASKWLEPSKLSLPSYIPSKTFAIALLDVLRRRSTVSNELGAPKLLAGARDALGKIQGHEDMKRALELIFEQAEAKATHLDEEVVLVTQGIESWFNDRMSRASGWYKRKAQLLGLGLAFLATGITNSDSIHVVSELWRNSALRDAVVAVAQSYYDREQARAKVVASVSTPAPSDSAGGGEATSTPGARAVAVVGSPAPSASGAEPSAPNDAAAMKKAAQAVSAAMDDVSASKLPIGWHPKDGVIGAEAWLLRIVGWLVTTLAVSLGAGFWFDALGNALGLRKTGPKVSATTGRVEDDG